MESKKTFIVGLVLALAVVWIATSANSAGAETRFGSWIWVGCTTHCYGTTNVICSVNEPWPAVCYESKWVNVCAVVSGSSYTCYPDGPPEDPTPCNWGNLACTTALDSSCTGP